MRACQKLEGGKACIFTKWNVKIEYNENIKIFDNNYGCLISCKVFFFKSLSAIFRFIQVSFRVAGEGCQYQIVNSQGIQVSPLFNSVGSIFFKQLKLQYTRIQGVRNFLQKILTIIMHRFIYISFKYIFPLSIGNLQDIPFPI